jgi:hypothetical protein
MAIPNVVKALGKNHDQGFEVLGGQKYWTEKDWQHWAIQKAPQPVPSRRPSPLRRK